MHSRRQAHLPSSCNALDISATLTFLHERGIPCICVYTEPLLSPAAREHSLLQHLCGATCVQCHACPTKGSAGVTGLHGSIDGSILAVLVWNQVL